MPKIQEEARIVGQEEVARQTFRMRLQAPKMAGLARPGQFFMLQVRGEGLDPLLKRPFSFHRIRPERGEIEVLYRVVGRGTWALSKAPEETRLSLVGPLGNGFSPPPGDGPVVLVAGGIGIAPLFELIERFASGDGSEWGTRSLRLFYGARTGAELLPAETFERLGIAVHVSTDDGSLGFAGRIPDLVAKVAGDITPAMLYACGPLAMQYHVARWAVAKGAPTQLSLESLMACGIGACLGCALPASGPEGSERYVHVCKDGPIFSAGAIQWRKIQTMRLQPPIFQCN